jgi:hypothetical protein
MNTALPAGVVATALGLAGYVVGLSVAYPGRAFSLTLLMFGMALALAGRAGPADTA